MIKKITFLLIIFLSTFIGAQNSNQKIIQDTILNLLNYSKEKSYDKAAKLILYNGEDKSRNKSSSLNPDNNGELNQAKRICKKISALLDVGSKYEFGRFYVTNNENGETIYNQEVFFISGEQKLSTIFRFIKIGKDYLLIELD